MLCDNGLVYPSVRHLCGERSGGGGHDDLHS